MARTSSTRARTRDAGPCRPASLGSSRARGHARRGAAQIALGTNLRRARGEAAGAGVMVAGGGNAPGNKEPAAAVAVSVAPRVSDAAIVAELVDPAGNAIREAGGVARPTAGAVDTSAPVDP